MVSVAANLLILLLAFTGWFVAGLGLSVALVPRARRGESLLLAPVLGMCLLCLVGLFQLTVLLTPLTPRWNLAGLALLSLLLCIWQRRTLGAAWQRFRGRHLWLLVLPCTPLVVSAVVFQKEGFQLLVGHSDQLQYCQDARHMLEEMHTGSEKDVPYPRQDYLVHDASSRVLPYLKQVRRGADTILASTAALTGLSVEEAFPVTVTCALVTLGLVLGFLARVSLRLPAAAAVLLQAAVLGSFLFVLLHVQGSLAMLSAVPVNLLALAVLPRTLGPASWRWVLLGGLLAASIVSIYSEAAPVNLIMPAGLLLAWRFFVSRRGGMAAALRVAAVCLIALAAAPAGVASLVHNARANSSAVCGALAGAGEQAPAAALPERDLFSYPGWMQASAVLGAISYYDTSHVNDRLIRSIAGRPWAGCLAFLFLSACGLAGLVRRGTIHRPAWLFAGVLAVWTASSLVLAYTQDSLRFFRSVQYAMPYLLIGVVLLAWRTRNVRSAVVFSWLGRAVLAGFVLVNLFTDLRTFRYLSGHDTASDGRVWRFNMRQVSWRQFDDELKASGDRPVLISGYPFPDTIRPFMIGIVLRDQRHVLGDSIHDFWPLTNYSPFPLAGLNTRLSHEEYQAAIRQRSEPWSSRMPRLISESVQAVVPVGHRYPREWGPSEDVYSPRRARFAPIADIVWRNDYSIALDPDMAGPLAHDSAGPYRLLAASGTPHFNGRADVPHRLFLQYDGTPDAVTLRVGDTTHLGRAADASVVIETDIAAEDACRLTLEVARPVKLRRLEWTPVD